MLIPSHAGAKCCTASANAHACTGASSSRHTSQIEKPFKTCTCFRLRALCKRHTLSTAALQRQAAPLPMHHRMTHHNASTDHVRCTQTCREGVAHSVCRSPGVSSTLLRVQCVHRTAPRLILWACMTHDPNSSWIGLQRLGFAGLRQSKHCHAG